MGKIEDGFVGKVTGLAGTFDISGMNGPGSGRYNRLVKCKLFASYLDCPVVDETPAPQKNIHAHLSEFFYRLMAANLSAKSTNPFHHKFKVDSYAGWNLNSELICLSNSSGSPRRSDQALRWHAPHIGTVSAH